MKNKLFVYLLCLALCLQGCAYSPSVNLTVKSVSADKTEFAFLVDEAVASGTKLTNYQVESLVFDRIDSFRLAALADAGLIEVANMKTPLHAAVFTENVDLLRVLLEVGLNPNLLSSPVNMESPIYGWHAYWWANNSKVMEKIGTPVLYAAYLGNMELVKLLVKHGANLDYNDTANRSWPPLMAAVKYGHYEVASLLLKMNAQTNYVAQNGIFFEKAVTPLLVAVENGDVRMVRLLIENGAYVNYRQPLISPLQLAKQKNNPEIISLLVNAGAILPQEPLNDSQNKQVASNVRSTAGGSSYDLVEAVFGVIVFIGAIAVLTEASGNLEPGSSYTTDALYSYDKNTGSSSAGESGYSSGSKAEGCSSDYQCGVGYQCIKPRRSSSGMCYKSVDSMGSRVFSSPRQESIGINRSEESFSLPVDCPLGHTLDRSSGDCIKREL